MNSTETGFVAAAATWGIPGPLFLVLYVVDNPITLAGRPAARTHDPARLPHSDRFRCSDA